MKRVKVVASSLVVLAFVVAVGIAASAQAPPPGPAVAVGLQTELPALYGVTAPVNECVSVLLFDENGDLLQVNTTFLAANATVIVNPPTALDSISVVPFFVYFPATALAPPPALMGAITSPSPSPSMGCPNGPTAATLSSDLTAAPQLWLTATLGPNSAPVGVFINVSQAAAALQAGCVAVNAGGCGFGSSTNIAAILQSIKVNINSLSITAGFGGVAKFAFHLLPSTGATLPGLLATCSTPPVSGYQSCTP